MMKRLIKIIIFLLILFISIFVMLQYYLGIWVITEVELDSNSNNMEIDNYNGDLEIKDEGWEILPDIEEITSVGGLDSDEAEVLHALKSITNGWSTESLMEYFDTTDENMIKTFSAIFPGTISAKMKFGTDVSQTLAHLPAEAGWYMSSKKWEYFNGFGIKAFDDTPNEYWDGTIFYMDTEEGTGTGNVTIEKGAPWRHYESWWHGVMDRSLFLQTNERYSSRGVLDIQDDAELFVDTIGEGGYYTASNASYRNTYLGVHNYSGNKMDEWEELADKVIKVLERNSGNDYLLPDGSALPDEEFRPSNESNKELTFYEPLRDMHTHIMTSPWGNRLHPNLGYWRMHNGVDFGWSRVGGYESKLHQPILASTSGVVTVPAFDGGGYGNWIIITHESGWSTRYAHLHEMFVKTGDEVEKGQEIGLMGHTGIGTGDHLHFEIRNPSGNSEDPAKFFDVVHKDGVVLYYMKEGATDGVTVGSSGSDEESEVVEDLENVTKRNLVIREVYNDMSSKEFVEDYLVNTDNVIKYDMIITEDSVKDLRDTNMIEFDYDTLVRDDTLVIGLYANDNKESLVKNLTDYLDSNNFVYIYHHNILHPVKTKEILELEEMSAIIEKEVDSINP